MTDKELMQQALDALEKIGMGGDPRWADDVAPALRARLAQPEQEPVAWLDENVYSWIPGELPDEWAKHYKPLYTAPPQREWVGLTEAERIDILDEEITVQSTEHFALAQAIEAKLKEKNNDCYK